MWKEEFSEMKAENTWSSFKSSVAGPACMIPLPAQSQKPATAS